jgi:hypothetical protein
MSRYSEDFYHARIELNNDKVLYKFDTTANDIQRNIITPFNETRSFHFQGQNIAQDNVRRLGFFRTKNTFRGKIESLKHYYKEVINQMPSPYSEIIKDRLSKFEEHFTGENEEPAIEDYKNFFHQVRDKIESDYDDTRTPIRPQTFDLFFRTRIQEVQKSTQNLVNKYTSAMLFLYLILYRIFILLWIMYAT